MPTLDQIRIEHDRSHPRLMQLWWALQPLKSVIRFMQTGAHPDDEISGMLAALAFREGINISYACSTRGEGGQNDIGTEAGSDLGALRTREMERACDVLGMRMYWHSTHPADTITDFGFSKSGRETLDRWGRERTLRRFVEIIRTEKPDIICPTFLDVPGQHGHHRAMTEAARDVMTAAADPSFDCELQPWQVKKLYLPAWSGAGQAYDDDLPPPPATVSVLGTDREIMSGWNWHRIGQQSRAYHRTQGMGRWEATGLGHDWPLHLAESHVDGPDDQIWSGLPRKLSDLAASPVAEAIASDLISAQTAIDNAIKDFPDYAQVASHAAKSIEHLQAVSDACPPHSALDVLHRVEAKIAQLGQVLRLALGVDARVRSDTQFVDVGGSLGIATEFDPGDAKVASVALALPDGWSEDGDEIKLAQDAMLTDPYRSYYDPIGPEAPHLSVQVVHEGTNVTVPVPFEVEPVVLPMERVTLRPSVGFVNVASLPRTIDVEVADVSPSNATVDLSVPEGWGAARTATGFSVTVPIGAAHGVHAIEALINGRPAQSVRLIDHGHVAASALARPAVMNIGVFDVALPEAKVGYIGAGNDRVGEWLDAMGVDVTHMTEKHLQNDDALNEFDTIVVGIFAMRFRTGLLEAVPALNNWVSQGGTLVTLYHRPWDNWDPDTIPPRRLEIGQPSLRWRVTDEHAKVGHLTDHAILSHPNTIGDADWDGWMKERGLYFAKSWDPAYTPLLSMSDPGEEPLTGALLVADIGKGRHVHTSLILHHQMENLVPGAFRLMANFISPRR